MNTKYKSVCIIHSCGSVEVLHLFIINCFVPLYVHFFGGGTKRSQIAVLPIGDNMVQSLSTEKKKIISYIEINIKM